MMNGTRCYSGCTDVLLLACVKVSFDPFALMDDGLCLSDLGFVKTCELKTANRTSKILCKMKLWVPSARIGGCHPGGVSISRDFEGGGGRCW